MNNIVSQAAPHGAAPDGGPLPAPVFVLHIEPHGWTAEADAALTLREAAAFAGIELPTSCRNGTCRACLCRLTAGTVRYHIPWPGLSAEEKQEGYVLPCVAHAASDVTLEAPAATREL